jgi:hypothetical protein
MAEEHPPVKAIRFGDIGGFFEEAFVEQEVYRTITAGISPYLSKKRGISLESVQGGGGYDGEYMAPTDVPYEGSQNYEEENIIPFTQRLAQSANNSSTAPIRDSAKRNSALKTALDTGNVTLAEELAQMMSGTHPTQPTPHAPSVGELHLQRMGQDIADATPGISVPADLKDYENLSTKQNPADLIANSPVNVALINTFIEVIRESTHADWKDFLDGVQLMDVTESAGKKWFANQMAEGGFARLKLRKAPDFELNPEKFLEASKIWSDRFERDSEVINAHIQKEFKSVNMLIEKFRKGRATANDVEAELIRAINASEGSGSGKGGAQVPSTVANHYLQVFADAFTMGTLQGKSQIPGFMEQQPLGDSGIAAFIFAAPYADSTGIGFKWHVEFLDTGGPGVATDSVIVAMQAIKNGSISSFTAQQYYDETRQTANDWYIQTAAREGASDEWAAGLIDAIAQPQLNIELMPDSVPNGFVGPITQLSAADFGENFMAQIKEQVEGNTNESKFKNYFNTMLSVANDATKAWYASAGVGGGELYGGDNTNLFKDGGIWPDSGNTFDDLNKGIGHDLGVSPFLVSTKEYVKIFGGEQKPYNIGLNPSKRAEIMENSSLDQRKNRGWKENAKGTVVTFKVDYRKLDRMTLGKG